MPLIFRLAHSALAALGSHAAVTHLGLSQIALHPVAIAAWVGMFATSLNLLPGGQLDGGHIIFAINPRAHSTISRLAILALLPLAWYFWAGWLLWAVVLRLTGSHPPVPESSPLNARRKLLALFGLLMLLLTFTWDPIPGGSLQNLAQETMEHFSQK
jgi:membrane-associated protease RseP (regulator of RpoE activity)